MPADLAGQLAADLATAQTTITPISSGDAGSTGTASGAGGAIAPAPLSPPTSAAPAPATPPAGAAASLASPPPAVPSPPASPAGVRDLLRELGLTKWAEHFQDDATALRTIAQEALRAQELEEYARVGKQFLPHADKFAAWYKQQQDAQAPAAPAKKPWWNPPEYDQRWQQDLVRDPQTGEIKPRPGSGATLETVQKYLNYERHRQEFFEKFAGDPIAAIRPGLEEVFQEKAQQLVEEKVRALQDKLYAEQRLKQHEGWLYARDQTSGQPLYDQAGQPLLTRYGHAYRQQLHLLQQQGVNDLQFMDQQARMAAENLWWADQYRQQGQAPAAPVTPAAAPAAPAPTPQQVLQQTNGQFLASAAAAHTPNAAGSLRAPLPDGSQPSQNRALPLRERMRQEFGVNGFTPNQEVFGRT